MSQSSFSDDIAYLKDLAESGQNAPLLGGRFMIWWGSLVPLAYIAHYLIITDTVPGGGTTLGLMWAGFVVLSLAGQFTLGLTFPAGKPGQSSAGNRASEYAWMSAGFALFAFFAGTIGNSFLSGQPSYGFIWSVPVVLSLYAVGQLVSGFMSNTFALKFAGFASLAGVVLTGLTINSDFIWLIGAATVFVSVLIPGIMLIRAEPSETV